MEHTYISYEEEEMEEESEEIQEKDVIFGSVEHAH